MHPTAALKNSPSTEVLSILKQLADARGEACEIAVGRYQAEAIEAAAVQKIHRVDHHGDVAAVLAANGWEMLRQDAEIAEHGGPTAHLAPAEIAVDAAHRSFA